MKFAAGTVANHPCHYQTPRTPKPRATNPAATKPRGHQNPALSNPTATKTPRYQTPPLQIPAATKTPRYQSPLLPNICTQESHLNSHINAHSYQQPRLSTPHLAPSNSRLYLLAPRTHHLAPRTTNPAATNLASHSYHRTLPIPPLPISQIAATCSRLPPRASPTRSYLPHYELCPYPNWNIPRTYRPAPTSSQLPTRGIHLAATGCRPYQLVLTASQLPAAASQIATRCYQLAASTSQLPARANRLVATSCRPYQLALTASQLPVAASQITTRRYQLAPIASRLPPRADPLTPTTSSLASSISRLVSNCSRAPRYRPAAMGCRLADRDPPIPKSKSSREYIPACLAPRHSLLEAFTSAPRYYQFKNARISNRLRLGSGDSQSQLPPCCYRYLIPNNINRSHIGSRDSRSLLAHLRYNCPNPRKNNRSGAAENHPALIAISTSAPWLVADGPWG
jgi:hypothetical protein